MKPLGQHITLDLYRCQNTAASWNDSIRLMFLEALSKGKFNVLCDHHHQFEPHGVSGVFILAESHLSVHIWTELNFVSLDEFWCGDQCDEQVLINTISDYFLPEEVEFKYIPRGFL